MHGAGLWEPILFLACFHGNRLADQKQRREVEGCRLTLGARGPPGMPRDWGIARSHCRCRVWGGLQPSVLSGACRGGCLACLPLASHHLATHGCGPPPRVSEDLASGLRKPRRRRCLPLDEPPWVCQGRLQIPGSGQKLLRNEGNEGRPVGCTSTGFLLLRCKMRAGGIEAHHLKEPCKFL